MKDFNTLYEEAHALPESKQKALRAILWKECGEMFAHLPTQEQLERALNCAKKAEDSRQYHLSNLLNAR